MHIEAGERALIAVCHSPSDALAQGPHAAVLSSAVHKFGLANPPSPMAWALGSSLMSSPSARQSLRTGVRDCLGEKHTAL